MTRQTDARGCVTNITYDELNRPTGKTFSNCPATSAVTYTYDQGTNGIGRKHSVSDASGLTVFAFPEAHRKKLRTNNTQERLNREIGRRTDVVSIFPNEAACLRLVSAILMEQDEAWQTGRVYLTMEDGPPQK